jgi:hypothetical protein
MVINGRADAATMRQGSRDKEKIIKILKRAKSAGERLIQGILSKI